MGMAEERKQRDLKGGRMNSTPLKVISHFTSRILSFFACHLMRPASYYFHKCRKRQCQVTCCVTFVLLTRTTVRVCLCLDVKLNRFPVPEQVNN